jgi:hypothetical protein
MRTPIPRQLTTDDVNCTKIKYPLEHLIPLMWDEPKRPGGRNRKNGRVILCQLSSEIKKVVNTCTPFYSSEEVKEELTANAIDIMLREGFVAMYVLENKLFATTLRDTVLKNKRQQTLHDALTQKTTIGDKNK